jgi:hypothetical protein
MTSSHEMSAWAAILIGMSPSPLPDMTRLPVVITTAELTAALNSPAQIRTLVRQGTLTRVGRGVFIRAALAGQLLNRRDGEHILQAAAALAAIEPGAVASHRTAAVVFGLSILGRPGPDVTLTRLPGRNRASWQGVRMHSAQLPTRHVTTFAGIPVTTATRTVLDLARAVPFAEAVVVADSALRRRLTSQQELRRVLAECQRWRGGRRAAEVIEFADGLSESPLESLARVVFRDLGLPAPELQAWVGGDEGVIGRVDFLWSRYRTIAEVDGAMKYDNRSEAMYQLRRDARLRAAGYEVVHFNWQEINEIPDQVAESIWAAFRRGVRAAQAPGPAA